MQFSSLLQFEDAHAASYSGETETTWEFISLWLVKPCNISKIIKMPNYYTWSFFIKLGAILTGLKALWRASCLTALTVINYPQFAPKRHAAWEKVPYKVMQLSAKNQDLNPELSNSIVHTFSTPLNCSHEYRFFTNMDRTDIFRRHIKTAHTYLLSFTPSQLPKRKKQGRRERKRNHSWA